MFPVTRAQVGCCDGEPCSLGDESTKLGRDGAKARDQKSVPSFRTTVRAQNLAYVTRVVVHTKNKKYNTVANEVVVECIPCIYMNELFFCIKVLSRCTFVRIVDTGGVIRQSGKIQSKISTFGARSTS